MFNNAAVQSLLQSSPEMPPPMAADFRAEPAVHPVEPPPVLPPPGTKRWVIRRKAAVVDAVRRGTISLEDACRSYNLSAEEFESWQRLIDRHGPRGLRATRVKEYREISGAAGGPARLR
jgi:hypothetical protein